MSESEREREKERAERIFRFYHLNSIHLRIYWDRTDRVCHLFPSIVFTMQHPYTGFFCEKPAHTNTTQHHKHRNTHIVLKECAYFAMLNVNFFVN